jgi:hypothetical protein
MTGATCGEVLWRDGFPIAVCTAEWGTEHSHSDADPGDAIAAGSARVLMLGELVRVEFGGTLRLATCPPGHDPGEGT